MSVSFLHLAAGHRCIIFLVQLCNKIMASILFSSNYIRKKRFKTLKFFFQILGRVLTILINCIHQLYMSTTLLQYVEILVITPLEGKFKKEFLNLKDLFIMIQSCLWILWTHFKKPDGQQRHFCDSHQRNLRLLRLFLIKRRWFSLCLTFKKIYVYHIYPTHI